MVPCIIAIFITPIYLWTDPFGSSLASSCRASSAARSKARTRAICERFPTEVRATAWVRLPPGRDLGRPGRARHHLLRGRPEDGLCHADDDRHHSVLVIVLAVLLGPETKGKVLTADLETMKAAEAP